GRGIAGRPPRAVAPALPGRRAAAAARHRAAAHGALRADGRRGRDRAQRVGRLLLIAALRARSCEATPGSGGRAPGEYVALASTARRGAPQTEGAHMAATAPRRWEHFTHGGALGVRGRGPTLEASFEQAALALSAGVCDPARVRPVEVVHFELEARDPEALLADWLGAVLDRMRARDLVF